MSHHLRAARPDHCSPPRSWNMRVRPARWHAVTQDHVGQLPKLCSLCPCPRMCTSSATLTHTRSAPASLHLHTTRCRIETHSCQHNLENFIVPDSGTTNKRPQHVWWGHHAHANPASATCTGNMTHHSVRVSHPHHHNGLHRCGVVSGGCKCCDCALVEQDGCKPGFSGDHDLNTCEICPSGSYCPGGQGITHALHCPSGTTTCDVDGRDCEGKKSLADCRDIDECNARDGAANDYGFLRCDRNARCTNSIGSFTCECTAGYRNAPAYIGPPGTHCDIDSTGCAAGEYRLNGADCVPCDSRHYCPGGPELPQRRPCASGFTTCDVDGNNCTGKTAPADCRNVNECSPTDRAANALAANAAFVGCDANATCTDTVGGHSCECFAGFIGNGLRCEECPVGSFEHQHRVCNTHTECQQGEVETVAAGRNNDRSCAYCPIGHKCVGDANAIPCAAGDQYQDSAGSTTCKACEMCPHWTSRVGCALANAGACEACASCPKGHKRSGCAGMSAGSCVYVCAFDNCWLGQSKLPWLASVDNWSLHSIPKANESAHVGDNDIVTVSDGEQAVAGILVLDGVIDIGAGSGDSKVALM